MRFGNGTSDGEGGGRAAILPRGGRIPAKSAAGLLLAAFALAAILSAGAQSAPAPTAERPALIHRSIPNGLELLLLPIPTSDRVSVSLVFRGGAEAQSAKTAGWFRLFERALFRGTASSPGEPEPAEALEALGASSVLGGTARDRLSFGFSLAPENLGPGLDTLAYLFSELRRDAALADTAALGEAKAAAAAEIAAETEAPVLVYEAAVARRLFSSAPWRLDALGSPQTVQAASAEDLKGLASAWLAPNNAALVLAGNFDPAAATAAAEAAFSSLRRQADPWKTPPAAFPKPGVPRPTLLAFSDASVPQGEAWIELRYRGPDSLSARAAQAELWAQLAGTKGSRLEKALTAGMPPWSSPADFSAGYSASRWASWLSLSVKIRLSAKGNPADAAMSFKEIARGAEMYALKTNASYFSAKELDQAKAALLAAQAEDSGDPEKAVARLADGWIKGGAAWIDSWETRLKAVSGKDLSAFADEYFMKNLEVVGLRLSPEDYAVRKKSVEAYGFQAAGPTNALWWQK